jgi:hypothetical protein
VKSKLRFVPTPDPEPEVQQRVRHYAHVHPDLYTGYCRIARIYLDRGYGRWTCLLIFDLLRPESGETIAGDVPVWFALGSGKKPSVSRRSKYFSAWILANGAPPRREDRMSAKVFRHRMAVVRVCDTQGPAPYSKVLDIVSWETTGKAGTYSVPSLND